MSQLYPDLTTLRPNEFNDPPQALYMFIFPDPQIGRRDPAFRGYCRSFGNDQPRTADGPAAQMHQMPFPGHPVK